MRLVILARHGAHAEVGRVLSGRSDIALAEQGHAEARTLADALAHSGLVSLHTSPRRRARETIAPFAERIGLRVRVAPELDEIDFGDFAGRTFAALEHDPAWRRWNAQRGSARCPGGETMAEAVERAAGYIASLTAEDCPALCVTHCDIIRGLVVRALGLDAARMFDFDCDPGSRTTLDLSDGVTRIVALNERGR